MIKPLGISSFSFKANDLKSARDTYNEKLADIKKIQTQSSNTEPTGGTEPDKKINILA
ncbi:hypothetical protein IJ670_06325 [bacterium]|nr:hypothetical protein [bacterium]